MVYIEQTFKQIYLFFKLDAEKARQALLKKQAWAFFRVYQKQNDSALEDTSFCHNICLKLYLDLK